MSKYSLILFHSVPNTTKIDVWELCKNGDSIFQEFVDEMAMDDHLFDKLAGALRIVENSANLVRMPKKKFRLIEGHNLNCKVYEAKSDIIRIYMFHEEKTGRVIVSGGKKDDQVKNIKSVIKTIKDYCNERKK